MRGHHAHRAVMVARMGIRWVALTLQLEVWPHLALVPHSNLQSLPTHVHHQIPLDLPASGTCTFLCRDIAQGGTAMEQPLTVSQLARATGMPAKTIRYYEQIGVLPAPRRSTAGYRQYSRHDVHRLLFIRRARALGLSLAHLKALTGELDSGECLTMRPRLHALVTEQLRTVQQQIAEFQLLERQLAQVLQRLQTAAPAPHVDGCRCLDSDTHEAQEPLQHPASLPWKGEAMRTSTLEPLTMLAPSPLSETNSAADEQCGCGCGCGVSLTQLALPQDATRRRGDTDSAPPTQP